MVIEVDSSDSNFSTYWPASEGRLLLAYSPDGQYLYTGGADSFVRAFVVAQPDEEPAILEAYFEQPISSLHCSFDGVAVCDEEGKTATFANSTGHAFTALITRTDPGSAARCARFGHSGRQIAVASDELLIKVIDVRDTTEIRQLAGHSRAVRSLGWNPDGSILVSASSDGNLRVWDVSASEPVCVRTLDGLIPAADPESIASVEPVWNPNGHFFAIPTKAHDIVLISREDWTRCGTFSGDGHNGEVTQLAWSPNGSYLASAGSDEQVIIWETSSRSPLYRTKIPTGEVSSLAWQPGPGGNSLSIADVSGQMTRWDNVIPAELKKPHPSDGPAAAASISEPRKEAAPAVKVANQHARNVSNAAGHRAARRVAADEDDDDGWIDDDMNGAYKDQDGDDGDAPEAEESIDPRAGVRPAALTIRAPTYTTAAQPAFQPGATPEFKNKRRYLAFNHIGLIYSIDHDHQNLIHVEFHDRTTYRGHQFDDNFKFTLASLGERGAAYAAPARGEHASVVNYRPYQSWTAGADWQYELPKGESAVALGVGGAPSLDVDDDLLPVLGMGCVVVGTDAGYIRFFGASGLQIHLIDLGEEIVSLAVGREWVMVIHRTTGLTADSRQNLRYTIIDSDTFEFIQQGSVPMMKQTTLQWIGFSDDQIPALYKSNGVLSLLHRSRRPGQARWIPALDTNTLERREGKQESYWPVSVSANQLHCIFLKGEEKGPAFPTPLMQELPLQFPTCSLDGEQGKLEESFLRDSVISGHVRDGAAPGDINAQARLKAAAVQMDASLLKIMQITSKGDRLEQALEAARLLTQIQSLDAAAKLAAFFHQPGLQERVLLIKEARSGEDAFEKERRESKWSHLIDNRTLVDSNRLAQDYSVEAISRSRKPATASSVLGRVVEVSHQKQSFGDSSALSAHKQFPPAAEAAKEDSGHGSSEPDYNETIPEEDDSLEHDLPMEDAAAASSSPAPVPPAKAPNPFAKATKPKAPPAVNSNPFAKKAAGNVKEIKRSDSFFNRVEAKTQGKAKAPRAAPKDASRQATIFGAAPPPEPEKPEPKKRGRKRKSDAEAEPEPVVEDPKVAKAKAEAAKQKKLSFGTKPAATASAEAEASATESGADTTPNKRARLEATEAPATTAETAPQQSVKQSVASMSTDVRVDEEMQAEEETQLVEEPTSMIEPSPMLVEAAA